MKTKVSLKRVIIGMIIALILLIISFIVVGNYLTKDIPLEKLSSAY